MPDTILELKGVCKYYTGTQSVVVGLNDVDLRFSRGEFVAITGESGSGKSTLAHIISGILPYEGGELLIGGRPTSHYDSSDWERYRRERISFISQSYGILPGSTVLANVVAALRITGMEKAACLEKAEKLLKMVELWDLRQRRAGKLSSGQKQRLSIARALAKPAPILVADEPTGNLDPENSAKVIDLLEKASHERLVILITHDFQEAENCATRRIILQDGRVITDSALRDPATVREECPTRERKRNLSAFVTRLQITGRPVWSALVLLFFALTAFGVFAFLGTFIVNLDDASTRIYDDSAFANGDKTRIVIQRLDSAPFTQEDWDAILSVDHARALERNSYLADWKYAWQQDVDYQLHYHVQTVGSKDDNDKQMTVSVELVEGVMDFLQTVPVLPREQEFLTAGRLPETMYEVVLQGPDHRIGECFSVYLKDPETMGAGSCVKVDVTVVGTTDFGSGLYFSQELSRVVNHYVLSGGWENRKYMIAPQYDTAFTTMDADMFCRDYGIELLPQTEGQVYLHSQGGNKMTQQPGGAGYSFTADPVEKLPVDFGVLENIHLEYTAPAFDNWIGVYTENGSALPNYSLDREKLLQMAPELTEDRLDALAAAVGNVFFRVRYNENNARVVDLYLYNDMTCAVSKSRYINGVSYIDTELGDLAVSGYHDSPFVGYALVSKPVFDQLAADENPDQVSLFIDDYAHTDRVLEDLQEEGYMAISPFRQGATRKNAALAAERMKTLQVCLLALAAVVLLQLLVLKELFGVQNDSFKLLEDMGLGCATAKRSILWQVLLFALVGQLLAFGAVQLCGILGIRRIQTILNYLPGAEWLTLAGVHLALSVAAGLMIMGTLGKKVYPQSGEQGDLDLEEEEAVL